MKKVLFILSALLIISLVACSTPATSSTAAPAPAPAPASSSAAPKPAAATSKTTAAAVTTSVAAAKEMKIKLAHYFDTGDARDTILTYWAKQTESGAKGVKIEMYPGGQIVSGGNKVLASVSDRVCDVSSAGAPSFEGEVPEVAIFGMVAHPSSYTNAIMLDAFKQSQDLMDKKFAKYNIKVITAWAAPGVTTFFLKKQITRLEDMTGWKIRTSGGAIDNKAYELLGLKSVSVSAGDQYMALQTGVIDGVVTMASSYLSYSLQEVAPYICWVTYRLGCYPLLMNLKAWNELTKDQQDAVMKAGEATRLYSLKLCEEQDAKINADARSKAKGDYKPTAQETDAWLGKAVAVRKIWVDKVGKENADYLFGILQKLTGAKYAVQ